MSPRKIIVGDDRHEYEKATLSISILPQAYDSKLQKWSFGDDAYSVKYGLEIIVDEHSGEDGELAPWIGNFPIDKVVAHTSPNNWGGVHLDGEICKDMEAYYGNDAAELIDNEVNIESVDKCILQIKWTSMVWRPGPVPFVLSGPVHADRLGIRARDRMHANDMIKQFFGEECYKSLSYTECISPYNFGYILDKSTENYKNFCYLFL